jgi:Fe-S-cluster containining protein
MKNAKPFPVSIRVVPVRKLKYDCLKCPGYCCTYPEIELEKRDIARLAKHFGISYEQAEARYTKPIANRAARMLRHKKDRVFASTCMLFDQKNRRCTVYEARPGVCRAYPEDSARCGYYDFLTFEREQQGDPDFIAQT